MEAPIWRTTLGRGTIASRCFGRKVDASSRSSRLMPDWGSQKTTGHSARGPPFVRSQASVFRSASATFPTTTTPEEDPRYWSQGVSSPPPPSDSTSRGPLLDLDVFSAVHGASPSSQRWNRGFSTQAVSQSSVSAGWVVEWPKPRGPASAPRTAPGLGARFSRKARFTCAGARLDLAKATARDTSASSPKFARRSSAGPRVRENRWALGPRPSKRAPWLESVWSPPTPKTSGGRSAVRKTTPTPSSVASAAAGSKFDTAVPEVVTTAATPSPRFPRPNA
mmetsp:Transcript_11684/g.38438  ORF Transcript_11684/g.38438 Transcript_11684/m.38438 type:complete len:279 (+) Transcript_11684:211-1047(+)